MKFKHKKGEVFAKANNPRCVVKLFRSYFNAIKYVSDGPFYKNPLSKGEFSVQNIGQSKLETYMKRMFLAAGIDIYNRKNTGHSGKRTMMSTLYNAGFDDHMVKTKSGNRSDSVRLYQVPNITKRKHASDILTPGI